MFKFGRKHQQEPEPDYRAMIEAAEERARRSVIAWASEQGSWANEESDEEENCVFCEEYPSNACSICFCGLCPDHSYVVEGYVYCEEHDPSE